jgi:hypothetical protein
MKIARWTAQPSWVAEHLPASRSGIYRGGRLASAGRFCGQMMINGVATTGSRKLLVVTIDDFVPCTHARRVGPRPRRSPMPACRIHGGPADGNDLAAPFVMASLLLGTWTEMLDDNLLRLLGLPTSTFWALIVSATCLWTLPISRRAEAPRLLGLQYPMPISCALTGTLEGDAQHENPTVGSLFRFSTQ